MERRGAFRCRIYRGRAPMMTSPAALRSASGSPAGPSAPSAQPLTVIFQACGRPARSCSAQKISCCVTWNRVPLILIAKKKFFTDAVESFADVAVYPLSLCCRLARSRYIDGLIRLILRSVCNPFAINTRWVQTPCFCQRPKNL